MKNSVLLNVAAILSLGSFSSAIPTDHESHRGPLGIINTTDLPAHVKPGNVRVCAGHPAVVPKTSANVNSLQKRECWNGKPLGCTDSFCWKVCGPLGSGQWCWTAAEDGVGDWKTCKTDADCSVFDACGAGSCDDCGCSC